MKNIAKISLAFVLVAILTVVMTFQVSAACSHTYGGYTVRYLHLVENSPSLAVNDTVNASSLIGKVGRTGNCLPLPHNNSCCQTKNADTCTCPSYCDYCGCHLHFDVRNANNAFVDPIQFFPNITFEH